MGWNDKKIKENLEKLFPKEACAANETLDVSLQVQPASIDLRLGNDFVVFRRRPKLLKAIDVRDYDINDYSERSWVNDGDSFTVLPGDFVLACTAEHICVPVDAEGRVDGRSSYGRLGLRVHSTAGFLDPGFMGNVTLELDVAGPYAVTIWPGDRICQVGFSTLEGGPAEVPYGAKRGSKYQHSVGVVPSRVNTDKR